MWIFCFHTKCTGYSDKYKTVEGVTFHKDLTLEVTHFRFPSAADLVEALQEQLAGSQTTRYLLICPQLSTVQEITASLANSSTLALSRETDWLLLDFFFLTFFGLSSLINMKIVLTFKRKLWSQIHQTFLNAGYYILRSYSFKTGPDEPTVSLCLMGPGPASQACGPCGRTPCLVYCSTIVVSKLLIICEQGAPTFPLGTGFCKLYSLSCMYLKVQD